MNPITVVIPVRVGSGNPVITLRSLANQTDTSFDVVVAWDENKGANWARNQGFKKVKTPYVLFSDDDIEWKPSALATLRSSLDASQASYAYGAYEMADRILCAKRFDPDALRQANYISTMSLVKTADFPGFDESIQRLQDWDVWLTMLEQGKVGIQCGKVIFKTWHRHGITYGGSISWQEAELIVKRKHKLL